MARATASPAPRSPALEDDLRDVLSAERAIEDGSFDPVLAQCGVPDTACRRTLVGAYMLRHTASRLATQGLSIKKAKCRNSFRFGNDGTLVSEEVAMFPARIGRRAVCLRPAVLGGYGSHTLLLLSKEL